MTIFLLEIGIYYFYSITKIKFLIFVEIREAEK